MGRKFTIFSNHHALQWLKTIKNPSGRLFRWSLRLSSYEYEVRYIKGKLQYEADLLSRNPFCGFLDATLIKTHQTFPSRKSNLTIDRNGLHTVSRKGVTKIIIPKPLIQQLLQTVHTQYNHPGISQMSRLISTQYYWQGMSKDIKQKFKTCPTCQLTKRPLGPTYGELSQPPEAKEPFDLLSLDTIAGFAKYGNTKIYLHVVVDHFSRYAWTFPSKSTSIITYQQVLKRVLQAGSPKRLLTDRAPAFTSPKFRSFLLNRNIHPLLTTSNNPQANGLCERLNATLTGKLRLLHLENPEIAWTKLVKRVTIIYNKTPHSTTGFPPIYLMFGILPPELSDHSTPYPDIDKARKIAHTRTQNKHLQDKNIYDQRHKQPHFEVGDLVLVKLYHHPNTGKLAPYFTGPHTILEIISPNVVRIDRPNQPLQRDYDTIHVNKLKLYTETIRYISPPAVRICHIKHNPNYTFPFKHLTPELFPAESLRFKPTSSEPFRHLDPAIFATRRFAPLFPDVKNCKPDNHFNHITPLPKDIKQCEIKRPTMNKCWLGIVRTEKFEALKRGLKSQQSLFTKVKTEQEAATRASFRVALEIAKRVKPFTDGEMIKECIIAVVEEMCPEKSTDVSDTALVLIYIRGVDKSYEVHEELLDMYSIHGTTTGTDIFKGVEMAINKKNLRWKNLKCITTDGGKNMSGKDKGVVALVSKAVENDGGSKPLVLHCIIHQQSLCGKCLDMSDVLKPVISTVNFIRSFGLNHRQFRQFIAEIGETDLPYHTAVRWLSCGKVLQRFFELRAVIEIFLNEKHRPLTELQNNAWLWKLAFYVDLTKHVNELNLRLQGENQHLPDLYTNIKSFRMKLILFQSQLRSKCFSHFKTCEIFSHTTETEFPIDFAIETLSALKINFDTRFSDFDAIANQIKIFQNPFDADIETLAPELQMEMIDLQCSDIIKNKYENSSLLEFYKSLPLTQFDNLHKFARGLFSVFGTTYLCEKTFSKMKYTKNVYRSKLTDEHLKSLLIIGTSKISPQLQTIVGGKSQLHTSH
ncbi:EPM2AIP1 [Cordylochernes scorpioides]|uniref:EPM2AIP1 n=1 Tax=Cordylochernes scorpioides TaxID=51811 RepID=A0ABY6L2E6_9ARAC|nr:EPM2AIP1 [Cordylochernes scorpioides]